MILPPDMACQTACNGRLLPPLAMAFMHRPHLSRLSRRKILPVNITIKKLPPSPALPPLIAFLLLLRKLGICLHRIYPLPDHKRMPPNDFAAIPADIIIMTEKDAVKYPSADERIRVLRIHAEVPPNLTDAAAKLARER